ncbi:glycosyltransferase [Flavobacterium sp. KB82]|uniref:Glycosyltransferase n=2 Tax=Flavobacterium hungaricum TaxID=2082725 RepID=A0ABR9TRY8_9FLAO|nr:glycosyltransferase [Flavobacterium hungaricum]
MVSIPSLHFFRWVSQLEDSGHEVFWFDVSGMSGRIERISWVSQKLNWKLKWNYPGRTFFKNKFPLLYKNVQKINENHTAEVFEKYIEEIKPDLVHSFALYLSCTPIISVMEKYKNLKWIYSSWGSDLFYFQNESKYLNDIKRVLPRINYLFTDCKRDFEIAKKYGFDGDFLGVFPGGGGFDLEEMKPYKMPLEERKIILIKGFQGRSGRAIPVLKAVALIKESLSAYQIIVFGADIETFQYVDHSTLKEQSNFEIQGKITHTEVLKLMGKSLLYIGNSNSDGIPNTMLEAVCMDVFPIQSNPGGATAEIISPEENGLLIEDCDDIDEIKNLILKGVMLASKYKSNDKNYIALEYSYLKDKVVERYNQLLLN